MPPRDPVVARVNDIGTTILDLLGMLALAAGCGVGAWLMWGPGRGLAVGGVVLMVLSLIAQARQAPPRPVKVPPGAHPLPGPEHPGPVHVKGR